jgi:hypothetical protein
MRIDMKCSRASDTTMASMRAYQSRPRLEVLVNYPVLLRDDVHGRTGLAAVEAYPGVGHSRVRGYLRTPSKFPRRLGSEAAVSTLAAEDMLGYHLAAARVLARSWRAGGC